MRDAIVGTAGHIDHGKTALITALTGVDTDRLPEEKERGISIDLGFTRLVVDDRALGVVDVPGHEDFIRNMLAGATGMDVLMLVVAGDEGVMPQTREHLAIAGLLGLRTVVPVVTKIDLVEEEWAELVAEEVTELITAMGFAPTPVHRVSAVSGAGLDELRATLAATSPPLRPPDDLFRLPLDRAFTVRGTGTVVTGTVWTGTLRDDGDVRILPGGLDARVRGIQMHGEEVDLVRPGQRAAVALAGIDREDAPRGSVLVDHDSWRETSMLTVRLSLLPGTHWTLKQRQRIRVHLGTAEVLARVRLFDAAELGQGDEGWGQLRLESPLVARAGDRVVLRSYSPVQTIGGGVVADPIPPKQKRLTADHLLRYTPVVERDSAAALARRIAAAGAAGVAAADLPLVTGAPPRDAEAVIAASDVLLLDGRAFPVEAAVSVAAGLIEALDRYHDRHPLEPGVDLEELRRSGQPGAHISLVDHVLQGLQKDGRIRVDGARAALSDFQPRLTERQKTLKQEIAAVIREGGASPPTESELHDRFQPEADVRSLLRLLEWEGSLVRVDESLLLDRERRDALVADVRSRLAGREDLDPADFREVIPVSRRYLIPILGHLDGLGITVRRDDRRAVPT